MRTPDAKGESSQKKIHTYDSIFVSNNSNFNSKSGTRVTCQSNEFS